MPTETRLQDFVTTLLNWSKALREGCIEKVQENGD